MSRWLRPSAWAFAVCLWHAAASASPLTADEAVARALASSPDALSAAADLEIAEAERAAAAVFLANPDVSAARSISGELTELSANQPLSLTGEGWFARGSARAGVEAAEATLRRTRLVVAAETRVGWAKAVAARQQATLAAQGTALGTRLREAVERQLEVGEAAPLDVHLARLAEAQAMQRLLAARARERAALADLARLIGPLRADDLPVDPRSAVSESRGAIAPRSDVEATRAAVVAAEKGLSRERAAVVPAVSVGAFYEDDGGVERYGPQIEVEVPLWSRNAIGVATARGRLRVATASADRREAVAAVEQEATAALLTEIEALDPRPTAEIVAEAEAALVTTDTGYRSGELDLTTAILLRNQILDGQEAALDLANELARARIDWMLAHEDAALLAGGAP